jgi:proteic killer suppression protein
MSVVQNYSERYVVRFKDKDIEAFWINPSGLLPKRVPSDIRKMLYRKLQMLDAAVAIDDLRVPPGNRLELLKKDRKGQYSIRVNNQWRLCFDWIDNEAKGVEFDDYH